MRVGCDPKGPGDWLVVPVTMDRAARNDRGGGFVTRRARFYGDNGKKMFLVEYYAWPEDPVRIGG
jgi:hypothetical protein